MKNSEQPIHPISEQEKDRLDDYPGISFKGLTKREYFAGLAMQGLLSNPYPDIVGLNPDIITSTAIDLADKLLKQLDNG